MTAQPESNRARLSEVAGVFLRLGCTAFGGPAAHVAMMRRELVEQRHWVTEQEFLDLFGAANLIPGPSSTELAILLGYRRAGAWALALAGLLFILPAMLFVFAFAWIYVRYGTLPATEHLLYGVKPVIIAIVALALWGLRRTALRGRKHAIIAGLSCVLLLLGVNPLPLLLGGGLFLLAWSWLARRFQRRAPEAMGGAVILWIGQLRGLRLHTSWRLSAAGIALLALASGSARYSPLRLFLTFLKIGAVVYGSGYVLLPFLRDDFVTNLHWITSQQLIDAVAVGQFTPGPVFTTATFVGYLTGGWGGGLLATLGIFLPSFFLCAFVLRLAPLAQRHAGVRLFFDGVNAAALGLMAAVTLQLGKAAIVDLPTAALGGLALVLLWRFRLNSAWFVAGGAAAGLLIKAVV